MKNETGRVSPSEALYRSPRSLFCISARPEPQRRPSSLWRLRSSTVKIQQNNPKPWQAQAVSLHLKHIPRLCMPERSLCIGLTIRYINAVQEEYTGKSPRMARVYLR